MLQRSAFIFSMSVVLLILIGAGQTASSDDEKKNSLPKKQSSQFNTVQKKDNTPSKPPQKHLYTGKVVNLQAALKQRGVLSALEFKDQVVLETPTGKLIPIVPDWRGRAFFQDKRLQNRKVDLVGYLKKDTPYLQVLMIFTYDKKGSRQYTDYWCDICSIPMYEIKPCDCCQAPIRLRFQSKALPSYLSPPVLKKKSKTIQPKKSKINLPSRKNNTP